MRNKPPRERKRKEERTMKARYWLVHCLVAEAFIENSDPEKNTVIDHINNQPLDNRACNLQYLSISENVKKGWHKNDNCIRENENGA